MYNAEALADAPLSKVGQASSNVPVRLIERRKSIRFPIDMEARLRDTGRTRERFDALGKTVNVSSGGALLLTDVPVRRGDMIQAHVKWPVVLENCDLKLVLTGQVVWTKGSLIAIRRQTHEFRTVSRKR